MEINKISLPLLSTTAPARLLATLPKCQRIYWLARALDTKGGGGVNLETEFVCQYLDISPATFRRYVRECMAKSLFEKAEVRVNRGYWVRYRSVAKLCSERGLERNDIKAKVLIDSVEGFRYPKPLAVEAACQYWQLASIAAANKAESKKLGPKAPKKSAPDVWGIDKVAQGIQWLGKAWFSESDPVAGGSQEGIGKLLGFSRETVCRWLSHGRRSKVNFPDLPRVQQMKSIGSTFDPSMGIDEIQWANSMFEVETGKKISGKTPDQNQRYSYGPNFYAGFTVQLKSKKHWGRQLDRLNACV